MTSVTIFGSGNMGTAIDGVLTAGGADVEHIGSADTNATVAGDIVILAVPYPALAGIVATLRAAAGREDRRRHHEPAELRNLRLPHCSRGQLRCRRTRGRVAVLEGAQGVQHNLRRHPGCQGRSARTRPPC